MVKYIGQDKQGTAGSVVKAPDIGASPLNQSAQSFQFAAQQQQQLGESLKSSLAFQSQTAARMSEDFSRTNQITAEAKSREIQSSGGDNGLGQALNNLANTGNMILGTMENRRKQEAAQAKAVRDVNAGTMWERISKWEVDAPAVARTDPGGMITLRNQLEDMFKTTEGADLNLEDRQALMKHAYGTVLAGLNSKNVEDFMNKQDKVAAANDNLKIEKANFEATTLITQLSHASTVEEQNAAISKLSQFVGSIATSNELQPLNKAQIQSTLIAAMSKARFTSDDSRLKGEEVLANLAKFQQDVDLARQKHPDDKQKQDDLIAISAHVNKIPTGVASRYSNTEAQDRYLQDLRRTSEERKLREEQVAYDIGGAVASDEAGYDLEMFPDDASGITLATTLGDGNPEVGKKTPRYQQYLAARKALDNFRTSSRELNEEGAKLELEKKKLAVSDSAQMIEYLKTLKPGAQADSVKEALRVSTGNNPALAQLWSVVGQFEQLDAQRKQEWVSQVGAAQEQLLNARGDITSSLDKLYLAKREKFEQATREIARYGYQTNGVFRKDLAKQIEERRVQREAARAAKYATQQEPGGQPGTVPFEQTRGVTTPHFNGLQVLYTHANSERGDLVLPITAAEIKRQGVGNYNEGVGWRAWAGRNHNGQDYGLDIRTPIVSHMEGVVTEVNYQNRGGGHYVRIKYADGTEHTQMHLYERPNLTVGQKVSGGQVIGKVGNTGMPGGNGNPGNAHLHWEVRKPDGSLWTPQEWSVGYRKAMENARKTQPGTRGPGASVTAPRMPGSVPIQGGALVPDGKGGAKGVTYTGSKDLKDTGQKKTPPSYPAKRVNSGNAVSTFIGPNGKLWGRDAKNKPFQLDEQSGVSSMGVSSFVPNYTAANPLRNLSSGGRPQDYNLGDLTNHHGFKALKDRPQAAKAINEAAKSIGVPGEWLAEVISIETANTFDPSIKEFGGSGATGIIQFFPDHDGGTYKTINGKRYDLATIGRMTVEQQAKGPLLDYIKEAMRSNGMKSIPTIQDLYSLVWAYGPASKARGMRDMRGPSGVEVLNRLGKYSGRRYSSTESPNRNIATGEGSERTKRLTTPVDTKYHASCTSCNQMASLNMFVPHERNILNKGMEIFNLA